MAGVGVRLGQLVINPARLLAATRGTNRAVGRDLLRRATNVQADARRRVRSTTGALSASIVKRGPEVVGNDIVVYVVTSLPYARYVHDGTRPHVIVPVRRKFLRFPVGGRTVFAKRVNHPGSRGNQFLTRALPAARG